MPFERHAKYFPLLRPLLEAFDQGRLELMTSELAIIETRVLPIRMNDPALIGDYNRLLFQSDLRLVPIDRAILEEAAQLRARISKLKTPDANQAATALLQRPSLTLTNDVIFRSVPGLSAVVLDDLTP
jgi:hypothetical protein